MTGWADREDFVASVRSWSDRRDMRASEIVLREMRTKWLSCSVSGPIDLRRRVATLGELRREVPLVDRLALFVSLLFAGAYLHWTSWQFGAVAVALPSVVWAYRYFHGYRVRSDDLRMRRILKYFDDAHPRRRTVRVGSASLTYTLRWGSSVSSAH